MQPEKQTKSERSGGVAQVVECSHSKFEALNSIPSLAKGVCGGGIGSQEICSLSLSFFFLVLGLNSGPTR
jgi:hypothetical protein